MTDMRVDWSVRPLTLVLPCLFRAPFEVTHAELCGALDAARAAGFAGVSLWTMHLDQLEAQGVRPAAVARTVAERGLKVSMLSAFGGWIAAPRDPSAISGEIGRLIERAELLGTQRIMAAARGPLGGEIESAATAFGAACALAGERGLELSLEFLTGSGIGSLGAAWDLVCRSGAPNAGIVLDAMQWQRAGREIAVLEAMPGSRIHMLQLCDGPVDPAAVVELGGMMQRDLPGEGSIDLVDLLARVGARAADPALELEIFHPELQSAGPGEAARRMAKAARELLASASREAADR
jgi:sugar phosphate isomerase/epimerase